MARRTLVIHTGDLSSGERWTLSEALSPQSHTTILTVSRGEQTVFSGGMGGPSVPWDDHIKFYVGEEDDFAGVVVRVDELVTRVFLRTSTSRERADLTLYPSALVKGVRVGAMPLARGHAFTDLMALDQGGAMIFAHPLPDLEAVRRGMPD
jgi:hypothetical protein